MHTFVYGRVSTGNQTTDNQTLEIEQAGYVADTIYLDTISGKVSAAERPEFAKMLDTIERTKKPKRLVVTKLDRLGRDAADVLATTDRLDKLGCGVRVLALGDVDLTTTAGKLIRTVLAAVSEMERDILIERTNAGLTRARREGKTLGRPKVVAKDSEGAIREALAGGESVSEVARRVGVSRATVMRIRDRAAWAA